jgi:hypothetical protein
MDKSIVLLVGGTAPTEKESKMSETMFIECNSTTILQQIGRNNFFAISGGRVMIRPTGITLPVAYGYSVEIDLAANDTYTVKRVYSKGIKRTIKGELNGVYCDEIGEVAYLASCYRQAMPEFAVGA